MNQLRGLLLNRRDHLGMAMSGRGNRDSGGEVEELVAIDILHAKTAAALGDHRIRTLIARREQAVIRRNDDLGLRSRERTQYLWPVFTQGRIPGRREFKYLFAVLHKISPRKGPMLWAISWSPRRQI